MQYLAVFCEESCLYQGKGAVMGAEGERKHYCRDWAPIINDATLPSTLHPSFNFLLDVGIYIHCKRE